LAETGASVDFDFLVAAASNSRVRFLRAIFCLRARWNLDLSPFTADILDSFDRVSEFLTKRATAGAVARASFAHCAAMQSLQQNLGFGEAYYAEVVSMWSPE